MKLALFAACLVGLFNGYGVVNVPGIPGTDTVQARWERVVDDYTHRFGCAVRQQRVLSVGEPTEERLRDVERYCDGTSRPSQPR